MNRRFVLGLVVALAAQTGIVGAMVWSRVAVLRDGQEIVVRSTFVDPRDIFRGHYVRLSLTIDPEDAGTILPEDGVSGRAYVTLREGDDGFWIAGSVEENAPATGEAFLETQRIYPQNVQMRQGRIVLPFDRYFADYDRAQELENLRREQKLGVILALDGKGGAVIKGLTIDGERVYDEPLW